MPAAESDGLANAAEYMNVISKETATMIKISSSTASDQGGKILTKGISDGVKVVSEYTTKTTKEAMTLPVQQKRPRPMEPLQP